jgi:hypothetical protein
MKARPVRRYAVPKYPTRLEVIRNPRLLQTHVPLEWLRNAEVAGVLGTLLAVNGCGDNDRQTPPQAQRNVQTVAPFFDHGMSRASGGGMVALPVFLSEDEAYVIIAESLRQAGVRVDRGVELPELQVRQYSRPPHETVRIDRLVLVEGDPGQSEVKPLRVDGFDPQKKIAFEFISEKDYYHYGGPESSSTVVSYDFKPVAESLQKQVKASHSDIYFGAFYSPVGDWKWEKGPDGQWVGRKPVEGFRKVLREQVADFIEWLKGQGVI